MNEAEEYLDECFCAYVEALVLLLTQRRNLIYKSGQETKDYFFEEFDDKDDTYIPIDLKKLSSLNYDED